MGLLFFIALRYYKGMTHLGIIMDPLEGIRPYKDSSFAMLLEAQSRDWSISYMQANHLFLQNNRVQAQAQKVKLFDRSENWFEVETSYVLDLAQLDVVLMRKDPPMDMNYFYATYFLDLLVQAGVLVVNHPQSLRDANEKLFTSLFPQCTVPYLVSSDINLHQQFLQEHGDIIIKPLGSMGGDSIFRVTQNDPNKNVIMETLTATFPAMAQKFIPEIKQGDKRILLIDGEPVPYALARIPKKGETRGNLAAGGKAEGLPLSPRDYWICEQVGPTLKEKGLLFVGLDVIGDYLTEINVTSPTCIRELDKLYHLNIAGQLMDCIEQRLSNAN